MQCRNSNNVTVRILVCFLILVCTPSGHADEIDEYIQSVMELQHVQGLALAVVHKGQPVKVKGYGVASAESGNPVTVDTVFAIASLSKQMIATATMLLIEDGKLGLEERISDYLEESPEHWKSITVKHLLTHTSGLQRTVPVFEWVNPQSNSEYVRSTYDSPLLAEPGEKWSYSNLGYYVLAEVIGEASGEPWAQYVTKNIFEPLEMTATRTTEFFEIVPNRATGHAYQDDQLTNSVPLMSIAAGGAFLTTISDWVKWDAALISGTLLSDGVQQQMWTPAKLTDGTATKYGYGWLIDEYAGHRFIRHGGGLPGFRADYNRFLDDDLSVTVFANTESAPVREIAFEVANHFIPGLMPERTTIKLDAEFLGKFAGRYQVSPEDIWTFSVDGSGLSVQSSAGGAQNTILPETETIFFMTKDESYVFAIHDGVVTHVTYKWGEGENQKLRVNKLP